MFCSVLGFIILCFSSVRVFLLFCISRSENLPFFNIILAWSAIYIYIYIYIWKHNYKRSKGSAVILYKAYYKTKIQEILEDKTHYKLIDTNVLYKKSQNSAKYTTNHKPKRKRLLNKLYLHNQ